MARKNQLTTADHLDYEEYERLLKGLHQDQNYLWELYARLSFCTACRASDVLNFRWIDVLDKNEIVVNEQKTSKTRRIHINTSVRNKLKEMWHCLGRPNRAFYIFCNPKTGLPYSIQQVNRILKQLKRTYRLSIEHFSTHTFRKTFGRYVYEFHNRSAESLLLLNRILNHTNIETTKAYIGITKDEINNIFDSIQF